jgi:dienelactone hydrolase
MTPILRGENGQAGIFSLFYDEVDDVLAALETLVRQPGVDARQIYVAGHSVGGTLTLLVALLSPRIRAAASLSGAPDHGAFIRPQPELAPYDMQNADEIRLRSPVAFAASFKCPVRLYWGNREPFFDDATRELSRLAKLHGRDVDAIQVEGDHMSMVEPAIAQAIAFFRAHP